MLYSKAGISEMFEGHHGPITGLNCHTALGPLDFSHLFVTSSFDWTVKLWSTKVADLRCIFFSSSFYNFHWSLKIMSCSLGLCNVVWVIVGIWWNTLFILCYQILMCIPKMDGNSRAFLKFLLIRCFGSNCTQHHRVYLGIKPLDTHVHSFAEQ